MEQGNKFAEIFKSPMSIAMLVLGVALVVGVPYMALQTLPGINNPVTGEAPAPQGDPNLGIDFQELNNLTDELAQSASIILSQEEPVAPEALVDLPPADGPALLYPVSEVAESAQPTLSWTLFAPGPFKVVLTDQAGQVVMSSQNIPNTAMVVQKPLTPGAIYRWQVTASNNDSQNAVFIVMRGEDLAQWNRVKREFPQSHLAQGLMAEHFGLLSVAEREYQALGREFPNAEVPARLYANVTALRE
jgi:hypothetical protein